MSAVGHAYWIGTQPLPEWLPVLVAFIALGGVIVSAFIALGGVIWSNWAADRRARQDREDAQQREFLQWRRESIMRLGTEALEAFIAAHHLYAELGHSATAIKRQDYDLVDQEGARIQTVRANLLLIGADTEQCTRLSDAITSRDLMKAVFDLNAAYREDSEATEATKAAATKQMTEALKPLAAAQDEFTTAIRNELQKLRPATWKDS